MKRSETKEYKEYMHNYYLKHKEKIKNRANEWQKANPDKQCEYQQTYYQKHKNKIHEKIKARRKVDMEYDLRHRVNNLRAYCDNLELIENYDLAKSDGFKNWHLHHRLENFWKHKTLKRKGLYYKVNPEALIFLPAKEHREDYCKSTKNPYGSKWHKHLYEVNNV